MVGPRVAAGWPDWTKQYESWVPQSEDAQESVMSARHFIMSTLIGLVASRGVDFHAAHRAFLTIDEYRQAIPLDVDGAEEGPNE